MTILFSILVLVLSASLCAFAMLYIGASKKLAYYRKIQDVESYQSSCELKAKAALDQCHNLEAQAKALQEQKAVQKTRVAQYEQLLGKLKSAAELNQRITNDTARVHQLAAIIGKLEHAVTLNNYIQGQEQKIAQQKSELESVSAAIGSARTVSEIAAQAKYYENYLAQLKADVELVEEAKSLQEFGFYRPRYNFESSEEYQKQLEQNRTKQKRMLSAKTACTCNTEWTVDGSKRDGTKMVNQQIKLMLRAFNGECDAAVAKARYNNADALEARIRRSFEQISKLGETKRITMSPEFCELKFEELHISHEYQQKKQDEKEEQRQIREQMKEEQKVAREIEEACNKAAKEEQLKTQALEQARAELAAKSGQQTDKLEALVARLEKELHEALDRKAKAIARAQLTKSGHVYILSNIGAFGEGVYKIGMSRRLEPLERVYELGGASVPFPFDVHAMIYSEDAPTLETTLHQHFADRRINMINLRREFFRVTLDEIRAAVGKHFGKVTFVLEPEADQFRRTLALAKEKRTEESQLQIA